MWAQVVVKQMVQDFKLIQVEAEFEKAKLLLPNMKKNRSMY